MSSRFYVIANCSASIVDVGEHITGEPIELCKTCGVGLSTRMWLPPRNVVLRLEKPFINDIVESSSFEYIVTERFRVACLERKIVGINIFNEEVEIANIRKYKKFKGQRQKYFYSQVVLSNARIDAERSDLVQVGDVCSDCLSCIGTPRADRIVLQQSTWSGEDIFRVRGLPGDVLVSERFKQFYFEHGFVGIDLVPAEEYSFDVEPWKRNAKSV